MSAISNCSISSYESLGTFSGKPVYLPGNDDRSTYARRYEPFQPTNAFRRKAAEAQDLLTMQKVGEQYSSTKKSLIEKPLDNEASPKETTGFFVTVKKFEDQSDEAALNCFAYAVGTYGNKLEKLAGQPMKEIQKSVDDTIDSVVKKYFTNISEPNMPRDGDLVVYSIPEGEMMQTPRGRLVEGTTHAGIYRENNPSCPGGSVESKWGWIDNPGVFQHDVFFAPRYYGGDAKIFRIKESS
jgi:hypothetical protein